MNTIRIIGIGSPFGDDQIGWRVVEAIAKSALMNLLPADKVSMYTLDRPGISLIQYMQSAELIILIDAMRSKQCIPGTVKCLDVSHLANVIETLSCHGFGVADALQLAKELNLLPPKLLIYGIEISPASTITANNEFINQIILQVLQNLRSALSIQ